MPKLRLIAVIAMLLAGPAGPGEAAGAEGGWWLNVFFYVDDQWRPGLEVDGWSPRRYETRAQCDRRREFAEAACKASPLDYPALWICSKGAPLREPPEHLRGILC